MLCGASGTRKYVRLDCELDFEPVSLTCAYDKGVDEDCSFPLSLRIEQFGPGEHEVLLTATDSSRFRYTTQITFTFIGDKNSPVQLE